ncbi:MAG: 2-oxoacid ferredoxin oxidoreductase, partial [Desulfobacteraceae bacterium]|nr:2-oxoacid ferredoxin oxidoreductase [Desulfobacteraceae bacterium]
GLTKGQASPTSSLGMQTKIQTKGTTSSPFNPIATALVTGAGFVAQGFSGNIDQLSQLIVEAVNYKGFSMIDIFQPCVSFNKINTNAWYKKRVFDLNETGHDASDYDKALKTAHVKNDSLPTGIIYKTPSTPFNERLDLLKEKPLFKHGFAKSKINEILNRT